MISKSQIRERVFRAQLKLIEPTATVRLNGDVYASPRVARSRALLRELGLEWRKLCRKGP